MAEYDKKKVLVKMGANLKMYLWSLVPIWTKVQAQFVIHINVETITKVYYFRPEQGFTHRTDAGPNLTTNW